MSRLARVHGAPIITGRPVPDGVVSIKVAPEQAHVSGALDGTRRVHAGLAPVPPIAVVTRACRLDWGSAFFTGAEQRPIVLTTAAAVPVDRGPSHSPRPDRRRAPRRRCARL